MLPVKSGIVLSIAMFITTSNIAMSNSVPHYNMVVIPETIWPFLTIWGDLSPSISMSVTALPFVVLHGSGWGFFLV